MAIEHQVYAALDYLRSRAALPKLASDCITIGLNAPLVLRESNTKNKNKQTK